MARAAPVGAWNDVGPKVLEQLEVAPPFVKGEAPGRTPFRWEGAARRPGAGRGVLRDIHPTRSSASTMWAAYDGVEVFRDLSFVINAGEAVALLGPNGCGKSRRSST